MENSAVAVLSQFIKKAWLETLSVPHKLWALDLSLQILTTGRLGKSGNKKVLNFNR